MPAPLLQYAPVLALLAGTGLLLGFAFPDSPGRTGFLVSAVVFASGAAGIALVMMRRQVRQREVVQSRGQARLSGIIESAMDAIITIDEGHRVVLFNAAAEQMFRCAREDAVGAPLSWFIPERFRGTHGAHIENFGATGTMSRRMAGQRVVTGLRRDGEEFPLEASISQLAEDGGKLYTVILRDITARVQADDALRRSTEELQELGSTAHVAREQEKSRFARELHDELGQALTMLQMDVAWCKAKAPDADFAGRLERMEKLLKTTVAATRRIAAELRPLMLDDLGLGPALEWLAQNFTQRTGKPCKLVLDDRDIRLDAIHSTAVFRIVQESLANIVKHADASRAEVAVTRDGTDLVVRIQDNGVGFATTDPRKPASFGLVGLRERAALLKGVATIDSRVGEGTTIEVRLPHAAAVEGNP